MEILAERQELFKEVEKLNLETFEAEITNKELYDKLADYLRRAKNTLKILDVKRDEEGRPFLEAHRAVQERYKPYVEKLKRTIALIDRAMVTWTIKQEEVR